MGADNRVVLKPVSIGRDLGSVIELASGLAPEDRVIQNPSDGIANGAEVRLLEAPSGSAKPRTAKNLNDNH